VPETRGEAASRGIDFHKSIEDFLAGVSPSLPPNLEYYQSWFTELRNYEIYPEHVITLNEDWQPTKEGESYWYKGILDLLVIRRGQADLQVDGRSEGEGGPVSDKGIVKPTPPREAIIYDWKTGGIYPDHDDQKSLYSRAVFAQFPSVFSVRAIHVYVDKRQIRERTFHRDQMHELRTAWDARAQKFLKALESPEGMIPNPGFHCRWCPFSAQKGGPCRF
jgi:hypothetical protein